MKEVTNSTRRESFNRIQEHLGPRHKEVMDLLETSGPLTAWEVAEKTGRMIHTVRPRLCELAGKGLVETVGEKLWKPTDRNEAVWAVKAKTYFDVTGQGGFVW
jgi:predicted transcriptional regulator